ncbi:hemerythrin domain-containing protein [Stackebrandtia nassauensis]|uniref:Hemerythrin HHE cation binding domain protein n=1 Tax=Stackebrandtia nassauensis (strain DSM 44728 / CIP 108903 / NRRL B-16338 / NBRC 102104 / LLR-40K-21) TaxID=446470 RepID=D3PYM3_STANL|nr:hemerythrin domain-containing protein [Stackebrandtia nassauensis]ADD43456.1 Hemerythrin HHE cation binding domain protein [Stackebrandtia nassauensis DSM 44728]
MVTTAETNLVNIVVSDHRLLNRVFTELQDENLTGEWRRALTDALVAELVGHLLAEEHYLYPLVRSYVNNGRELADRELAEHAELKRLMKELEEFDGADPRFIALLAELTRRCRRHMADEEDVTLPLVGAACSPLTLQKRGAKMLRNKKFAPTRPHPDAPDRPPANLIVDPGAAFVDRLRDRIDPTEV